MKRLLILALLVAPLAFRASAWAGVPPPGGAALRSAAKAAECVSGLVADGDGRTLARCYPVLRDSLPEALRLLCEAILHGDCNRPVESNAAIAELLKDPATDPAMAVAMRVRAFHNFRSLNDYAGAARVLGELIGQLPEGDASRPKLMAFRRWMEAFSAWPRTTVRRPAGDVEVQAMIRPMGRGEALYVDVRMNGRTQPFIFDTGCSGSNMISETMAHELGVRVLADSIPITGMTTFWARVGVADSLSIGAVTVLHPTFIIIPDELTASPVGPMTVLGNDVMNRLGEVRIEANRGRILFPATESDPPAEGSNMTCAAGQFYLWPEYEGTPLLVHFDTGNVKSTLSENFYATYKRAIRRQGKRSTSKQGGVGGVKELEVYVLPEVAFTLSGVPFVLRNAKVNICEKGLAAERDSEMGSLGTDFLRAFDGVTVNFRGMYVLPYNDPPRR